MGKGHACTPAEVGVKPAEAPLQEVKLQWK